MNEQDATTHIMDFLPLTIGLWLCYLLSLALIDHLFYPRPVFPPAYYLVNACDALVALGLAHWLRGRIWQEKVLLPLVAVFLSVVPIITSSLLVQPGPPTPASSPESMMFRQIPLLLMGLILTAWQYGWLAVLLYSGGAALLMVGLRLVSFRAGGPFWPFVTVLLIQTISFLVVGYFISALIERLQQQQTSLAQANAQLTAHAATLEELTISRERNRMARELHDTLAHTLSGLSVQLETVKAYWEVDAALARGLLETSLAAARAGLQETRRALKSLRAAPLEDLGLALALRQVATETAARIGVQLHLSVPDHLPQLTPPVEQCIYRVAQEAVANVAHHANARNLRVELVSNGETVLRVSDDGHGFDPQQRISAGHFGLRGMRERAALVGGVLTISSQPGQGTTIQLCIKDSSNESCYLR